MYEVFDSKYDNELIFALRSRLFSLKNFRMAMDDEVGRGAVV